MNGWSVDSFGSQKWVPAWPVPSKDMKRPLRPTSLPLLSPIYFQSFLEPFAYDSPSDGPASSAPRCHLLCPILARTVIVGNGADIHKRCRANLAKELSGLSSARRT